MDFTFRVRIGNTNFEVSEAQLARTSELYGLKRIIPGRFSRLFVLDMHLLERVFGVDPFPMIDEINYLEGSGRRTNTNPAKPFRHPPLVGLWHKHYFSARFMARNISDHLGGRKLIRLVEKIFDPKKSNVVTEGMINELAHRVTIEPYEKRANAGKLTGEWIIFAEYQSLNYYLTLTTHEVGDNVIYNNIKTVCEREFPFLADVVA